jgi:hypothetical protein
VYAIWAALVLALVASLLVNYKLMRLLNEHRDAFPPISQFIMDKKCEPGRLVGHWPFEALVTRADHAVTPDESGYSNHARVNVAQRPLSRVLYGLPAQTDGKDGKAIRLHGKHWLSAGNNHCFTGEQFTVAAWVWLEKTGLVPTIVSKSTLPHNGWFLVTTSKPEQRHDRYLELAMLWPGGFMHVESGYQLPLQEWHHVVVTADNVAGEVQFYIDGKPRPKHQGLPKWQTNWDHDFIIGDYDGSGRWPWIGRLDDVRFYNYVLSDAESTGLYSHRTR